MSLEQKDGVQEVRSGTAGERLETTVVVDECERRYQRPRRHISGWKRKRAGEVAATPLFRFFAAVVR